MTDNGNGNGNGGVTIKLSKWQAGILSTVLAAAMIAAFVSILSFNAWKIRTDERLLQMQAATSVPRSELELREKIIYAEIEQVRQRVMSVEREVRQ